MGSDVREAVPTWRILQVRIRDDRRAGEKGVVLVASALAVPEPVYICCECKCIPLLEH